MSKIPPKVAETDLSRKLQEFLPRRSQGKVRDIYNLPGFPGFLLVVATDRISALDAVLPNLVPDKGYVLTKLTVFWSTEILDVEDHLVAWGQRIDEYLQDKELLDDFDLQRRSVVIREAKVQPFELIFRYHLGGSVYKDYRQTNMVAGIEFPKHLPKWCKLSEPAFAPSTKAQDGHDVNITVREYYQGAGNYRARTTQTIACQAYKRAYAYARKRGILILDTKFEFEDADTPMLLDEILTPDSSRFTPADDWDKAMKEGRDPIFMDKEPTRVYCRNAITPFFYLEDDKNGHKKGDPIVGLGDLDLNNPEELEWVQEEFSLPPKLIAQTSQLYRAIDERLTGQALWPV